MASEPIWSATVQDSHGDDVTIEAFADGDVQVTIDERGGDWTGRAQAVFGAKERDHWDRAYMEACRRADGEQPAMPGRDGRRGGGGHPLVTSAQAVARAEDRALEARDG